MCQVKNAPNIKVLVGLFLDVYVVQLILFMTPLSHRDESQT